MTKMMKNLINGEWVPSESSSKFEILNPADGKTVEAEIAYAGADTVKQAVAAASNAFPAWRDTPVIKRCRILFHCKELLENNFAKIAECIVKENGKTMAEAEGEVRRGIEVVEFAAGMPSLMKGDFIEDIATNVDGFIYREPLGVIAGACPFNFPAMIPMWMFPVAIACGNTFVLKPSEKCPMTATLIAEIFQEGGLPNGVLNVVQGDRHTFQNMIDAPEVEAVSFVGSTPAAEAVWKSGTANLKRVQALGGAKNYIVVMPDADVEQTVKAVIGSSFGCAGERCMASSVMVLVGESGDILEKIVQAAASLKVGNGMDKSTQMGPLITAEHKNSVDNYIEIGKAEGAEILLDGRESKVPGAPEGYFTGPTLLDNVTPEMRVAKEEIFGPVLSIMRAENLNEALDFANSSEFGNGASIFTNSGASAREFRKNIQCGMIGINAGVPAPMAFFSFGGHKKSIVGDLRAHGPDSIDFYTRKKAITERWFGTGETGSVWGAK